MHGRSMELGRRLRLRGKRSSMWSCSTQPALRCAARVPVCTAHAAPADNVSKASSETSGETEREEKEPFIYHRKTRNHDIDFSYGDVTNVY